MKIVFTLSAFLLLFTINAQSQNKAGTPDSSFGVNGKVTTSWPKYSLQCSAAAPQNDGSIIATGTTNTGFFAIKYSANGAIDQSFGINGFTSTNKILGEALSMAIQPDDKILVGGYYAYMFSPYYVSMARFNANGTIDSTFGNNGILFISGETRCTAIAIQPDKKILIEGDDNKQNALTMRLLPNGIIDSTFGINGVAPSFYGLGNTIAIQKDGKIVAGGRTDIRLFFIRYNTNGHFDSSFGTAGKIFYDFATGPDIINDLALQTDGKIVAIGSTSSYWGDTINEIVLRCLPDGSLDQNFGKGGLISQNFSNQQSLRSIALQKDGKLITCGSIGLTANTSGFLLKRYTTNGFPDSTFGNNGYITTKFDSINVAYSVFLQDDSKIVLGGVTETPEYQAEIALARYNNDESKKQIIITKVRHWINNNNIKISPNPATNILHIDGLPALNIKLTVVDIAGNVAISQQLKANSASPCSLNIALLKQGNYLLKIETNDDVVTKQFVKD
ncbi:MAG: T9SS type A sorting domain-containing protein [Parafilimonas sp.]|nr:T9SS type A sorting domain-containing protein [Parafilimonas sp.]